MVKYYIVEMPSNVYYFEVNDDVNISDMDFINDIRKDPSGNEISMNHMYYTLGVLQKDAKARITKINALPDGMVS